MAETKVQIEKQNNEVVLKVPAVILNGRLESLGEVVKVDVAKLSLPEAEQRRGKSQLLEEVPERIPGIEKITKLVEPEKPDLRLFVIKNIHGSDNYYLHVYQMLSLLKGVSVLNEGDREMVAKFTKNQFEIVQRNQCACLTAVEFFNKERGIDNAYFEGTTVESFISPKAKQKKEIITGDPEEAKKIWGELQKMKPQTEQEINNFAELKKRAMLLENSKYVFGTSLVASLPANVTVLPTESQRILEMAADEGRDDLVTDCREDLLLHLVDHLETKGDKVALVVFGGAHNFKDNVIDFNEKYQRSIALTVLEPLDYAQDRQTLYGDIEKVLENSKLSSEFKDMIKQRLGVELR